ncbi:MAG: MoaD/ThiS family protein [Deltaproteobacteria bacterium]|nr:MoaD/ThiS family protein [Deltaproteobacteria bacterium]
MRIVVKAYNEMRRYAPQSPADGSLEVPPGSTVRAVLAILGIPSRNQADLPLFRNGRPADLDTILSAGDTLVVFAPMSGG